MNNEILKLQNKPFLYLLLLLAFALFTESAKADKVKILDIDSEALQARVEIIRMAKKEIFISYFIFADDHVGHLIAAELLAAKSRGVDVRIIIDATNNHLSKDITYRLVCSGIDIHIYNKYKILHLERFIKYRMHDKIMLVDDEKVILGGRNIEDKYYGLHTKNFTDRDVYIEGEFAHQVRNYFLDIFNAEVVEDVFHKVEINELNKHYEKLTQSADKKLYGAEIYFYTLGTLEMDNISRWKYGFIETNNINFLYDNFAYKEKQNDLTAQKTLELINTAQDSILIDSPYLVPTDELYAAFEYAIKKGIYIRILTNSLYSTDGKISQAAYLNCRKKIAKMGIDLYEYYDKNCFHAKSMVIGNKAIIGSMNLDVRSFYLNKETIALFNDEILASKLKSSMMISLQKAVKIKKNGKPTEKKGKVGAFKFLLTHLLKETIISRFRHLI